MGSWILDTIQSMGYLGLMWLMFVENVFPPIPSELIVPLAGYLASDGSLNFMGVVCAGTAGALLGTLPFYWAGRALGETRVRALVRKYGHWFAITEDDIDMASRWFERHGAATVFFGRLIPAVRSVISLPAGLMGMPFLPFLLYSTLGSFIWTFLLASAGYLLGTQFEAVAEYLDPVSTIVAAIVVVLYVRKVWIYRRRNA
jgi:membrane protein DedA with SNARE-associated domain